MKRCCLLLLTLTLFAVVNLSAEDKPDNANTTITSTHQQSVQQIKKDTQVKEASLNSCCKTAPCILPLVCRQGVVCTCVREEEIDPRLLVQVKCKNGNKSWTVRDYTLSGDSID
jgi:hypothetical protein